MLTFNTNLVNSHVALGDKNPQVWFCIIKKFSPNLSTIRHLQIFGDTV